MINLYFMRKKILIVILVIAVCLIIYAFFYFLINYLKLDKDTYHSIDEIIAEKYSKQKVDYICSDNYYILIRESPREDIHVNYEELI